MLASKKKFSALRLSPCPPIQWPSAQPRVMTPAMPTKAMMALTGVRRAGWTRPIQRGSRPSRPALKISRALGVHRGDEHAEGGGQPGQVRDEGQPGRHGVGDGDERDEGAVSAAAL